MVPENLSCEILDDSKVEILSRKDSKGHQVIKDGALLKSIMIFPTDWETLPY